MTPSKARRVTQVQQEMLLQFMQENPEFAARRTTNPLSRTLYDQKWEELAITLNGSGEGSQKSVAEWRKVGVAPPLVATSLPQTLTWSDWRKNVRLKASGAKDVEGKIREVPRNLTGVERRLLDLVGTGTPSKPFKSAPTPSVTVTARPTVYALPQPIISHPPPPNFSSAPTNFSSAPTNFSSAPTNFSSAPTNFSSAPTNFSSAPTNFSSATKNFSSNSQVAFPAADEEIQVLEEIESDPENSHAVISNSKDGYQESSPQFSSETPETNLGVGVTTTAAPAAAAGLEGGSRGGWRPGSLHERQLALEERRLLLEERRLRLEERRVQHEEWRAAMDRETHDVDMDMKRVLLKHMRRADSN